MFDTVFANLNTPIDQLELRLLKSKKYFILFQSCLMKSSYFTDPSQQEFKLVHAYDRLFTD